MPDIARIIDALPAVARNARSVAIGGSLVRFGDDDQPVAILQRIEGLAAKRMALDECRSRSALRPRLAAEQADDRLSVLRQAVSIRARS